MSDLQFPTKFPSPPLAELVETIHRTSRKRKGSSVPLWDSDDIDAYWEAEANEPEVVVPEHQLESIQRMVAEMEQYLKTVTGQMEGLKGMIEMVKTNAEPKRCGDVSPRVQENELQCQQAKWVWQVMEDTTDQDQSITIS